MKLARDVARDADAGRGGAGVGHGPRDVRCSVVKSGDGRARAWNLRTASGIGVAEAQVLNKAGEGHDGGVN